MADLTVRRIVIACDATCDIRVAVEEAAVLAKRWNAALHGIFLQDENLYRLAGLPFGRQVTLSSAVVETLSAADLDEVSSAQGAAMRRALAEAAARRGLQWSFGVVRDLPTGAALAGVEGDILVVQGAARPFSGSWRPRSSWDSLPEDYARPILIRRESHAGPGIVLMLPGKDDDCHTVLLSGLAMAGPQDEIVILLHEGPPSGADAVKRIAASLDMAQGRKFRLEAAAAEVPALLRQIEQLKPALIVVDAGEADRNAIHDLLAGTRCDVLLLR